MNNDITLKVHCFSEALSLLTHMSGTNGNESVINREIVYKNGKEKKVPVLSGNSLRHVMVRKPGAMFLIDALNLKNNCNIDQLNFLLSGGSLYESSTNCNLKRIANVHALFPLYRLLGGSLSNQILEGSLCTMRGTLICDENLERLNKMLPEGFKILEKKIASCEDFISSYQYTRKSTMSDKDAVDLLLDNNDFEKNNAMIYSGQGLIPGSLFYHGFILKRVTELEIGALLNSLFIWESSGGTIGGFARIGHGKIKTEIFIESPIEFEINNLVDSYKEFAYKNATNCKTLLDELFYFSKPGDETGEELKRTKKKGKKDEKLDNSVLFDDPDF